MVAIRAAVVEVATFALLTLAVVALVPLPQTPLLRLVVPVVILIASFVAVAHWHEAGAPWPEVRQRRARAADRVKSVGGQTAPTRMD